MAKKKKRNRQKARGGGATASSPSTTEPDKDEVADDEDSESSPDKRDGGKRDGAKRGRAKFGGKAKQRGAPGARTVRDPKAVRQVLPDEEPRFWFGFEVSWAKLVTARFVVFGMLALDALLQIRHAPRYGAGHFNVANLGFLDELGPGRAAYGVCQLLIAYFLMLTALGVATRIVLPIAAVLYAWLYFGSQLDSYQHHYLVSLVLAISCFVPWQRPRDATAETPVRSWALRLVLVQLGIMYLWAAISKLDAAWLDGTTLGSQVTGSMKSLIEGTIGFKGASVLVIVVEFALAAMVWMRPTWMFAAPLGVLFHIGIVATGFEIGLFAYLMVALYILVIPDRVWIGLARGMTGVAEGLRGAVTRRSLAVPGIAVAAAIALALSLRLPSAFPLALVLAALPIASIVRAVRKREQPMAHVALAHLLAIVLWVVVDRTSGVAADYYRFWGGAERRIGDKEQSEYAYRKLIEIDPDSYGGHFQLGRLLLNTERFQDGLDELHQAQRIDPKQTRAYAEEARWLLGRGRRDEAVAKAREAVAADPSDSTAKQFLDSLIAGKNAPAPKPDRDPE
jgi:hypothetical protein